MAIRNVILVLLLALLTSCPKSGGGGKNGSVIPPNPPNTIVGIHGKWTKQPTIYIEPASFNGYDAKALCLEVINDMNTKYNFKMTVVPTPGACDILVKYYNHAWTKSTSGFEDRVICGFISYGDTKGVSMHPEWTPPTPENNYAGLTYSRVDGRKVKQECLVWMNAYMLMDGKGYPASFKKVFTHELGHVLGFEHATADYAMMYPRSMRVIKFCPEEEELINWLYQN